MHLKGSLSRCSISGHIFVFTLLLIIFPKSHLQAGLTGLSESIQSHLFFVEAKGTKLPVIGVESDEMVIVQTKDKEFITTKMKGAGFIGKALMPAGRVTVVKSEGLSNTETTLSESLYTKMSRTTIDFQLVADRDLTDVYVVLFFTDPKKKEPSSISFAPIGNLTAGKVSRKSVSYPLIQMKSGSTYHYEFFTRGFPIEQFRLNQIVDIPKSRSLRIPWEIRLAYYLEEAANSNQTIKPKPFNVTFPSQHRQSLRSRGIESLQLVLNVLRDGVAHLEKCDSRLTEEEISLLRSNVGKWQFFPAIFNGKPEDTTVNIPLKL